MRTVIIHIKSLIFTVIVLINSALAQNPPYISSIDKVSAAANETLTIIGLNFPTNAANLSVKFGAAEATVISTSATLIEVTIPGNATTDNISVTDKSSGLIAYSNEIFNVSHGGNSFTTGDLDTSPLHTESTGFNFTFDVCMCDFDNNGTNDIVTTNNEDNSINIFTNNSTSTTINLTNSSLDLAVPTANVTCGDLDGDGLSDLVITRGGSGADRFFVLKNTSPGAGTISFDNAGKLSISLPLQANSDVRSPKRPIIQDIDLDGKPDIILSNVTDNVVYMYKNNSSGGLSFVTPPFEVTVSEITVSSGIDVKDLNNDGFPEILLIDDQASDIHILPNLSEPGSISMGEVGVLAVNGVFRNLKSGDLNNDGLNDIVATNQTGNTIIVFENTTASVGGNISFSNPIPNSGTNSVWGIDLFDAEGDGDLDIVAASINERIYILTNDNLTFQTETIDFSAVNDAFVRNIKAGDINADGKPDIVFTYKSGAGIAGELGVITNRNCVTPTITPSTDRTICTGTTIRLEATGAPGANYDWQLDGGSVKSGTDNFLDITGTAGSYTVTLSDGLPSGCSVTSSPVIITVDVDPAFVVTAGNSTGGAVVCIGTDVTLTANTIAGATYTWSGPNGFSSASEDPVLSSVTAEMAGTYTLFAEANGCTSNVSTTTVLVETVPLISVRNDGQDVFCVGSSIDLKVTDHIGSYSYSWNKDGSPITGETATTLTVTESGGYSAVITATGSGCFVESPARTATAIALPVPDFTASDAGNILSGTNTSICFGLPITFDATATTGHQDTTILYSWTFGDGNVDTGDNVTNTYAAAGNNTVTLITTYPFVNSCSTTEQTTLDLTITDIPTVSITVEGGTNEKCPSDALRLNIPDNFSNYLWSSGETINFIDALDPNTYSVSATDQFGCDFTTAGVAISNFASSGIDITSTSTIDPVSRSISLLEGQLSVELTVNNAIANIAWTPSDVIGDTTLTTVEVFVQDINTLVTVFGDDAEGCMESDTVRIINPFIRAKKSFSPNGDGIGDECWEITNSRDDTGFSGCTIFIFDTKGRLLQQLTGPFPDDCVWEGNINGSPAPEGVYYYALKCSGTTESLSGSILLAR